MNNNDAANVELRLKKSIIYTDKILSNFPKKDYALRDRIYNCLFDILELQHLVYYHVGGEDIKIIKQILAKLKLLDFYLQMAFDRKLISNKKMSTLGVNLREITTMYYAWLKYCEKKK